MRILIIMLIALTPIGKGATVRYAYVDRDGAKLANVDIAPGLCS